MLRPMDGSRKSDRHVSSRASTAGQMGSTSGQVFWLPDHPTCRAFPSLILSGTCGVRPRLQRRDRDGFAPSSLFSRQTTSLPSTHVEWHRTSRCPNFNCASVRLIQFWLSRVARIEPGEIHVRTQRVGGGLGHSRSRIAPGPSSSWRTILNVHTFAGLLAQLDSIVDSGRAQRYSGLIPVRYPSPSRDSPRCSQKLSHCRFRLS